MHSAEAFSYLSVPGSDPVPALAKACPAMHITEAIIEWQNQTEQSTHLRLSTGTTHGADTKGLNVFSWQCSTRENFLTGPFKHHE